MNDPIFDIIAKKAKNSKPAESLKFLFYLQGKLYKLLGEEAIRYGEGTHPKHWLINYHHFFIKNINSGDTVLDIGCGDGSVAKDIAVNCPHIKITAIDISSKNIDKAREKNSHRNIKYRVADACKIRREHYEIIVLSNVLEHIEDRKTLLKGIRRNIQPRAVLIRVPMFQRCWTVPLRKELDINYMLDPSHFIEYTEGEFREEICRSGYKIKELQINWGEFWSRVEE